MASRSKDVAVPNADVAGLLDDSTLADIGTFTDALQTINDAGIKVTDITDLGTGFRVVPDKQQLVGVPFVIIGWKQRVGEYGDMTVAFIVTEPGDKWILVDGSTGIHNQLSSLTRRGVTGGVLVRDGLTVSSYEYEDGDGNKRPARTFYLTGL